MSTISGCLLLALLVESNFDFPHLEKSENSNTHWDGHVPGKPRSLENKGPIVRHQQGCISIRVRDLFVHHVWEFLKEEKKNIKKTLNPIFKIQLFSLIICTRTSNITSYIKVEVKAFFHRNPKLLGLAWADNLER